MSEDFFNSLESKFGIKLNDEQRDVVLNEDEVLKIIAGAGTGKTTTLAAKVKYLIDVKKVPPSKIVCLTFSPKCADELRHKVCDFLSDSEFSFEKQVSVYDFPHFGLELLKESDRRVVPFSKDNYEHLESRDLLEEFIINEIHEDNDNILIFDKFKRYFPYVFNLGFKRSKIWERDLKVKNKGDYEYDMGTFQHRDAYGDREIAKTFYDLRIADFLFMHKVKYEILKEYSYKDKTVEFDFYLPGPEIYIEYFRLNEYNGYYNLSDDEINEFNEQLKIKRAISNETDANVIFIDYYENINDLLDILSNELNKYVVLEDRDLTNDDIRHYLDRNNFLKHLKKISDYFYDFIRLYKEHDFKDPITDFSGREGREIFFLDMVSKYYDYYQNKLKNERKRDFSDMITESTNLIKDFGEKDIGKYINYDYILVDEYQDISKIRFKLLCELQKKSGAKLIVFGDDWQSIYGFSGSKMKYFLKFKKNYFSNAKELPLNQSYRCCQDLLDVSSEFVSEDDKLFKKPNLFSKKQLKQPLEFWTYSVKEDQYVIVYEILNHISKEFPNSSVMILSRYRYQRDEIRRKLKNINADKLLGLKNIDYYTIHESKGFESDNVIILDVNRRFIPSQFHEESLLRFVSSNDPYDKRMERKKWEERRLFYVALTRARNKVYLTTYDERKSKYFEDLPKSSDYVRMVNYKHNPCFNPLRVRNKYTIKRYWDCKKELSISNQICPECNEGHLIHYEINKKHYVICSEFNNTCNYFIDDAIELLDDFYLKECNQCHKGLTYRNSLYNYSDQVMEFCTYTSCKYNKKRMRNKIDSSQNQLI